MVEGSFDGITELTKFQKGKLDRIKRIFGIGKGRGVLTESTEWTEFLRRELDRIKMINGIGKEGKNRGFLSRSYWLKF
jgi:hypothetical protein